MSKPKGISPKEEYKTLSEFYTEGISKYASMNKATIGADKLLEKLSKASERIDYLKTILDKPHLSSVCKSYLCSYYIQKKYGMEENIKNKYFEKGISKEEDAITLYSLHQGEFFKKNTERKFNEFIEGELDIKNHERVIDTKVSWSMFQFMRTSTKPLAPLYYWQQIGYMWLWGLKKGRVAHCLLNTPEKLIAKEEKALLYDFIGSEEDYNEACKELRKSHIYDDIPVSDKVKIFDVDFDESKVDLIKSTIIDCRKYLQEMEDNKISSEFDVDINSIESELKISL